MAKTCVEVHYPAELSKSSHTRRLWNIYRRHESTLMSGLIKNASSTDYTHMHYQSRLRQRNTLRRLAKKRRRWVVRMLRSLLKVLAEDNF